MADPDNKNYTIVRVIENDNSVNTVACLSNTIFSGDYDDVITKWDQRTGQVLKRITNVHAELVYRVVVSTSGEIMVSCGETDPTIKVMNTDLELQQSLQHDNDVLSVAVLETPESTMIAAGTKWGKVKVWKKGSTGE